MTYHHSLTLILLAFVLWLPACGPAVPSATPAPSPTATATFPTNTPTRLPPTSTPTPAPCNPASVDFCIENGYFVFQPPIAPTGKDTVVRGYPYGSTQGGKRDPHHGVEFEDPAKTPVLAAADGIVYYAGNDKDTLFAAGPNFYGNLVVIKHDLSGTPYETLYTLYAHLSKIEVTTNQAVTVGQEIGQVGMTGAALGNHLHFEVRIAPQDSGSTLNPELWLIPHAGNGALAIRAADKTGMNISPDLNLQYYSDPKKPAVASYLVDPYAPETVNPGDIWNEVAAIGDLPAGRYRVTMIWEATLYIKWIDIQPGKLTLVAFVTK